MRVMIVDWDRDAICQFEKQCEEISYVKSCSSFTEVQEALEYAVSHEVEAVFECGNKRNEWSHSWQKAQRDQSRYCACFFDGAYGIYVGGASHSGGLLCDKALYGGTFKLGDG